MGSEFVARVRVRARPFKEGRAAAVELGFLESHVIAKHWWNPHAWRTIPGICDRMCAVNLMVHRRHIFISGVITSCSLSKSTFWICSASHSGYLIYQPFSLSLTESVRVGCEMTLEKDEVVRCLQHQRRFHFNSASP